MTRKQRLTKNEAAIRGQSQGARPSSKRSRSSDKRTQRAKGLSLSASADTKKGMPLHGMKIADFYRPLKRPITLRLDADVLAWFKKDGRRYQTRINTALRKVMEREMKAAS